MGPFLPGAAGLLTMAAFWEGCKMRIQVMGKHCEVGRLWFHFQPTKLVLGTRLVGWSSMDERRGRGGGGCESGRFL